LSINIFEEINKNLVQILVSQRESFYNSDIECLQCDCLNHTGEVYLNKIFELPLEHLYECLFGMNEFYFKFYRCRKISGFKN
jgi:hypothetical protein